MSIGTMSERSLARLISRQPHRLELFFMNHTEMLAMPWDICGPWQRNRINLLKTGEAGTADVPGHGVCLPDV